MYYYTEEDIERYGDRIRELEQERDALKDANRRIGDNARDLQYMVDSHACEMEERDLRIAKLEAIVKYHSSHSPGCDVVQTPDRIVECSCGYNAKLAALSNAQPAAKDIKHRVGNSMIRHGKHTAIAQEMAANRWWYMDRGL